MVSNSCTSQDHLYRSFQELIDFFPWIKPRLTDCEPSELERILKEVKQTTSNFMSVSNVLQLQKGGDVARGDDASKLKKEVVNWLTKLFGPVNPPISPSMKSDRGLENDVTGCLLCPIEYDWNNAE